MAGEGIVETRTAVQAVRLTDRDRQLMRFLAIARYLSTAQISRLLFPGRVQRVVLARLQALSGKGPKGFHVPLLRRLTYRTYEGALASAWALTSAGYAAAQRAASGIVAAPSHADVGAEFMEHAIALNDLFVALTLAASAHRVAPARAAPSGSARDRHRLLKGAYARANGLPFLWLSEEASRLPWREYDLKAGAMQERSIQPDAILEIPAGPRRYFVEQEMGTHPIVSARADRPGATLAKVERYAAFLSEVADRTAGRTWYGKAFPDLWPAEVLFVVLDRTREAHVNAAIAARRQERPGLRVVARALTLEAAVAELVPLLGLPSAPEPTDASDPGMVLTREEARALEAFCLDVLRTAKAARAEARAQGRPVPDYPVRTPEVHDWLRRMNPPEPTPAPLPHPMKGRTE